MATIDQLRKRVWDLYVESTPKQKMIFFDNVQKKSMLESGGAPKAIMQFSVFNHLHAERAAAVYTEFFAIAEQHDSLEPALEAVIERYETLKGQENPDLLYYALSVFITHHPFGRVLTIPNILVREPELAVSSKSTASGDFTLEKFDDNMGGASGVEGKLDWFREDPQQNEHHEHWHYVFPFQGVPGPGNTRRFKDRQGEMFLYMHQQMLARYAVERIALNLPPLKAFSFESPIEPGYNPGEFISDETGRVRREPDTTVDVQLFARNQSGQIAFSYNVGIHLEQKQILENGFTSNEFQNIGGTADDDITKIKVSDVLGKTLEPSGQANERLPGISNYHGMGHVLISKSHLENEVDLNASTDGVMAVPNTAIRDAIFFRWHKHIDDYYFRLQEQYATRDFADAPDVFFDHKTTDEEGEPISTDIILCLNHDVPGLTGPDFGGKSFGELAFGGDNWDKDFSSGEFTIKNAAGEEITFRTTDTLITNMNKAQIQFDQNGSAAVHSYEYLHHNPFSYFVRIRNNGHARTITCRIFMVPEGDDPETSKPFAENRRLWIEMDKCLVDLKRNSNNVLFQFDRKSSVIRKPAQDPAVMNLNYTPSILGGRPIETLNDLFAWEADLRAYYRRQVKTQNLQAEEAQMLTLRQQVQANLQDQQRIRDYWTAVNSYSGRIRAQVAYCECGWPYNLLVPRGTMNGMKFKLMVMATDAAHDLEEIGCCGSMSYCGAKDLYPDKRPMGYPFDRKFTEDGIVNTLNALSNVAFRTINIQCDNINAPDS